MKLKNIIKSAMIGAMLVSGTYTFVNPVDAKAATNNNKKDELTDNAKEQIAYNTKVKNGLKKIEEKYPIAEGARIISYTEVPGNDFVKKGNFYRTFRLSWQLPDYSIKVNYAGIAIHTASSYEQVMYSTTGNHIDSKAKLTAKQKKIIRTLKSSKTYSKKFRYVAVYDTNAKWTDLRLVPNNGNKAIDELYNGTCYSFDSKEGFNIGITSKKSPLKTKVKIAYALNVIPHIGTEKAWYNAFAGSKGVFHGYFVNVYDGEFFAFKSKYAR